MISEHLVIVHQNSLVWHLLRQIGMVLRKLRLLLVFVVLIQDAGVEVVT